MSLPVLDRVPVRAVIIAAMDAELAPFEADGQALGPALQRGEARLRLAEFSGQKVLLVRCGIGMANAAAATVAALERVEAPLVISVGSAGGFEGRVKVGEVAVGTEHRYHQADARAFGYELGQIPGMPAVYPADQSALAGIAQHPGVVLGLHVTGDMFVAGALLDRVREDFPEAVATEMEATAIAQVAHSLGVGFVSVRGISDLCGVEAAGDHAATVDAVSKAAADVVALLLSATD